MPVLDDPALDREAERVPFLEQRRDTGGYRVWYSTERGGPYNLFGATADKTVPGLTVRGLSPNTTYYFVVDSLTNPHAYNLNTVISERTPEVAAKPLSRWPVTAAETRSASW